jgi:2-dehydropantoate 2-reductase
LKILVMGSGAVGGYYGALLSRAGHDITFVARGEHLEAIRRSGLRVESVNSGTFTIAPRATDRPDGSWTADLSLFCVKSYDNARAISAMGPAVGEGTSILTLQNGIGSGDELGAAFGRERVMLGVSYVDGVRSAPGVVGEEGGPANIVFGEQDEVATPRAEAVRAAMEGAGINVGLSSKVGRDLWSKLVYICALSGMTCITRAPFADVLSTPETLDLTWRVMREVKAVADARDAGLAPDVVESTMALFEEAGGRLTSSMFTDLERGNPLEVDVLNGAVARLGKELGVATPVNDLITACLTPAHKRGAARRPA